MSVGVRFFSVVSHSKAHLAAVQETYFQHMRFASTVGAMLAAAGIACILHSLLPSVCTGTASRTIRRLNTLLDDRQTLADARRNTGEAVSFVMLLTISTIAAVSLWLAGASAVVALPLTFIALGLPAALLITNPELELVEEPHVHA